MTTLTNLRTAHHALRSQHHRSGHAQPVAGCDRCHPEIRRFWDDSQRIITISEIADDMAQSHPREATDPEEVTLYADDCAGRNGALDELLPLPPDVTLTPEDVLLTPTSDGDRYEPLTLDTKADRPGNNTYFLLNQGIPLS